MNKPKKVFRCGGCSNAVVLRTAGFIQDVAYKCASFQFMDVEPGDGCTFGDDCGPSEGYVPFDVDLSMSTIYQRDLGDFS